MPSDLSTLPSKPRVGGSNPSERAEVPSATEGATGRNESLKVGLSPDAVPAKLGGRSGSHAPRPHLLAPFSADEVVSIRLRLSAKTSPEPNTGCHLWVGAATDEGYGKIGVGRRSDGTRRVVYVHRLAYEIDRGPIPEGLTIDHLCRVRCCVNPKHMEAVTAEVNTSRRAPSDYTGRNEKAWVTRRANARAA